MTSSNMNNYINYKAMNSDGRGFSLSIRNGDTFHVKRWY